MRLSKSLVDAANGYDPFDEGILSYCLRQAHRNKDRGLNIVTLAHQIGYQTLQN